MSENNSADQRTLNLDAPVALQTLVDPEVFRATYLACKTALMLASGNRELRNKIADLARTYRQLSLAKLGHESSYEAMSLAELLRDTNYGSAPTGVGGRSESPLERLYRLGQLGSDEMRAASLIQQVWETFDRFLGVRSTNFSQGGGGRGFSGTPAMGSVLSTFYRRYYTPWYDVCRFKPSVVVGTRKMRPIDVVLQFIVHHQPLRVLADAYGVSQQDVIDLVKDELLGLSSRMEDADQSSQTGGMPTHATSP